MLRNESTGGPGRGWLPGLAVALGILVFSPVSRAQAEDAYEAQERSVTLDPQAKPRLGITSIAAKEVPYRAELNGLGLVIGLDAVAQTEADLESARAAARASHAALARARGLFGADMSVSQQSLEAAEHQATSDTAQFALMERRAVATWGPNAPWRDPQRGPSVLAALGSGKTVLIRATFPADMPSGSMPSAVHVERFDDVPHAKGWSASGVWRAPADPNVPGRSYYMLVPDATDLATGERVRVLAQDGESHKGAFVPASAIVVAEGGTWFYIEEKANYFVRRAADLSKPVGEGYFMPTRVHAGEPIVVQGAGQLLAREIGTED